MYYTTDEILAQDLSNLNRGDFVYSLHDNEWLFVIDKDEDNIILYNKNDKRLFKTKKNTTYKLDYDNYDSCEFDDYGLYFSEYNIPTWLNVPVNEYKLNNVKVIDEDCEYTYGQFVNISYDNKEWKYRRFAYKIESNYFYFNEDSEFDKVKYVKSSEYNDLYKLKKDDWIYIKESNNIYRLKNIDENGFFCTKYRNYSVEEIECVSPEECEYKEGEYKEGELFLVNKHYGVFNRMRFAVLYKGNYYFKDDGYDQFDHELVKSEDFIKVDKVKFITSRFHNDKLFECFSVGKDFVCLDDSGDKYIKDHINFCTNLERCIEELKKFNN